MDKHHEVLIKLLSSAIRGHETIEMDCTDVDWKELYNEAIAHQVYTLVYPVAKNLADSCAIDDNLMAQWNRDVLLSSVHQIQHIDQMSQVISSFNKAGIPVIALKGLVLRECYPNPDLRTMSDADILVHSKDIDEAINLLLGLGYNISSSDNKHVHFDHDTYLSIELHKSIIDYDRFSNIEDLENDLWQNSIQTHINSIPVSAFSLEHQLLHIFIHMASHIKNTGFGLRQLCDMVVWVEDHIDSIDWKLFMEQCKSCKIDFFIQSLFILCHRLFGISIPQPVYNPNLENEPFVDILTYDILGAGVFGTKTKSRVISYMQQRFAGEYNSKKNRNKLYNGLSLIFLPPSQLASRYSYAKKYPVLIPVAWIHRVIWYIRMRNLSFHDIRDFIFPTKKTKSVSDTRSKLLNWLQLR